MRRAWLLLVMGCGRVAFSPIAGDGGGTGGDTGGALHDAGPSLCGQSIGTLVCDGFENPTLASHWETFDNVGLGSIDSTRPYRGTRSFHFKTNATDGSDEPYAELRTRQGLMSALTGLAHARVWAYLASPWAMTFNQLIAFSDLDGTGISVATNDGHILSNDFTDLSIAETTAQGLPLDQWFCLQFEAPSGMSGTTRVLVDGVEVADVTQSKTNIQPPFDNMYLGLFWSGNTTPLPTTDMWFDEVILDDAPTSCAQ